MLETAISLAREAHAQQRDKLGHDYFDAHLRPIAEAAGTFGKDASAAGWLHDILEDTEVTVEDLRRYGFPNHVVAAVESVIKRPSQPYDELITRACADPLGRLVKLVDNAWNITCNPALAIRAPEKAEALLVEKYLPARKRLLAASQFDLETPQVVRMQDVLDSHFGRVHAGGGGPWPGGSASTARRPARCPRATAPTR